MKTRTVWLLAFILFAGMLLATRCVSISPWSKSVLVIGNGKQTVALFWQHGHWCVGYWRDYKSKGYCDLSLATDGEDFYLQQTDQRGKPQVRSLFR